MKSFVGWLVVLALIIAGGVMGLNTYRETNREFSYKLDLGKLQAAFERQSTGLHLLGPEKYQAEIGIHLERYFRDLRKLGKEYPEHQDFEREFKYGEQKVAKGHMNPTQKTARDERIQLTVDLMNKMRQGHYRPLHTTAHNGFRFDIHEMAPAKIDGQDAIKMSYIHWGAFGPVDYQMIEGVFTTPQVEGEAVQISKLEGASQPPTLQVKPQRWVLEFMPGLEIGYYLLPRFPREAEGIKLRFDFSQRTIGGSRVPVTVEFPEMKIPESWKIQEGKTWKAEERFASDEEIEAHGVKPQISVK